MKILVSGGAGFIGSHLVDRLVENHEVTIMDNLSTGKEGYINKEAEFLEVDLKDRKFLMENTKGFDVIFHLAAKPDVSKSMKERKIHINENTSTTHNLLEAAKINDVEDFIFTSSSTVYGEVKGSIPESHGPLKPISLYGASKLSCEAVVSAYSEFGINSWILRLANIVGGRSDHGVIPDFIKKLKRDDRKLEVLGDGMQEKSYLYVDDCIDGILHAYENSSDKMNIFNIGSEDTIKVKEIARIVREEINLEAEITYTGGEGGWKGDVPKFHLNISKMRDLGWEPKHNSKESVRKTVNEILNG